MMKEEKEIRQRLLDSLPEKGSPNAASFIKAEYLERQEAKKKKKGGFRIAWAMPIAAAVLAVAIVTPLAINNGGGVIDPIASDSGNSGHTGGNTGGGTVTDVVLRAKHEDVAENVESGLHFLELENPMEVARRLKNPLFAVSNDVLLSHLNELNPFLPTAERMMWDIESASSLTYTEGEEYPYALTMEDGDVLRYKETRLLDDDEADEDEEEFRMSGYIEGTSYTVTGTRENEVNPEEEEYETDFIITLGDSGYSIEIESESETEEGEYEESYKYFYRQGNSTLLEVELSYEKEVGEEEMVIKIKDTSGDTDEYSLRKSGDSALLLHYKFKYQGDDQEGDLAITIDKENALYIYKDSAGSEVASLPRA